jgi:hypothetical protein
MLDWYENENGNYVYSISKGDVMTVFKKRDGEWGGIYDGKFLRGSYDDPEEAQERMERWVIDGDSSLAAPPRLHGWQPAQKGGFYKNANGGIATVKQAKSGKWFITINGDMVQGVWLNSPEEAKKKADEYVEYL